MLDLCLRVALLSTLYVSSLSLERELESVYTKSLDELASGNDHHLLSLKLRKRADDNNGNQQSDKNMKKTEYDGKRGEQTDSNSLVKRVHSLYGKVKFGGLGRQNDHWSSSSWNQWRNAFMKRGKDEKTKSGRDNSGIDKRAHHLYGNLKFGRLGGQSKHLAGSSWNWRNAFKKMKRGKDGKTKSGSGNSGIDKRAHRLYGNVRFGGSSRQWPYRIGSHSNSFKNVKREKDEQTKLAGVDRNREKRARSLYSKLKFGSRPSSWNLNNPFNNLQHDGATNEILSAL